MVARQSSPPSRFERNVPLGPEKRLLGLAGVNPDLGSVDRGWVQAFDDRWECQTRQSVPKRQAPRGVGWRSGLLIRCTELTRNRRSRLALSPPCQRLTASPSRAYTRNCRDRSIGDGRDNNDLHARLSRGGLAGGRTRSDIAFRLTCRFHSTKRVKPCYARSSA